MPLVLSIGTWNHKDPSFKIINISLHLLYYNTKKLGADLIKIEEYFEF
jgi:hypothetical protein